MVLDVREGRELDICQLKGALHIPMAEIPARVNDLPTNQPLVVICHHGARSQMVVDFKPSNVFPTTSLIVTSPRPAMPRGPVWRSFGPWWSARPC